MVRVRTFVTINVIALLALAWLGWVVVPGGWRGAGCTLQVLAIGNGSTMLLTAPGAHAAILDVGTDTNSDPGETAALALHAAGLRHVEAVVVSHGNFDHHSGLPTLLRRVPVERWLTNSYFTTQGETESSTDRLLRRLPDGVSKHDVLRAGERLALGEVTLEVLWPRDGLGLTWDDNNASLVMRISAAGRTILVTGDIERDAMKALVEGEQAGRISLKSDVLIAPHHGAVLKNVTGEFYAAVSPSVVVVSTRTERPKLETLVGNVLGPKVRIVETGRVGAVTVRITPAGELLIETPFCRPPGG